MPVTTVEVDAMEWWCQSAISSIAVAVALCYLVWYFYTEIFDYTR